MMFDSKSFWIKSAVNTLAIVLVASLVPGVVLKGILAAIAAGLIFGFVNSIVKPILIFFTLPLTLLTFGLFLFVVNGLSFWLVAGLVKGFYITNIFSAIFGALLMSLVSMALNWLVQQNEPNHMHVGYFK